MPRLAAVVTTPAAAASPAGASLLLFQRSAAGSGDLDGLGLPVGSLSDLELDEIVDGEAPVAFGDDGGLVDEKLLGGAVVGGDETESL